MTTSPEVMEESVFDSPLQKKRATSSQRRPGPKKPNYGIPPAQWTDVLRRAEQGETLRQIAKSYGVSYQTIWRTLHAARKRQEGGEA